MVEDFHALVAITTEKLNLADPAVIEKDYFVTKALNALNKLDNRNFKLIFSGSTSLSKAHGIIKRMSEDIDFKIVNKHATNLNMSSTALRKKLKEFRGEIIDIFKVYDFKIKEDAIKIMNEGRSIQIWLDYKSIFEIPYSLRPQILFECTYDDTFEQPEILNIASLIRETLLIEEGLEIMSMECVSILETAAEKWVSITRRIAAVERGYINKDTALIRHLYDLEKIKEVVIFGSTYYKLIEKVIFRDQQQYKNQYPEYFVDPNREIHLSLKILKENKTWEEYYDRFLSDMVYEKNPPTYQKCLSNLYHITESLNI